MSSVVAAQIAASDEEHWRFTTRSVGTGTGLGLATVQSIVEQSGGTVSVSSTVGEGTTFEVLLPCTSGVVDIVAPTTAPKPHQLDGTRVIVVDDEPLVGAIVTEALESAGCQVRHFTSPNAALEAIADAATDVDLLISDVVMPEISGPELVRRANELNPHIAVLLMTGYAAHEDVASGTTLFKPFTMATLLDAVAGAVARVPR